MKDLLFHFGITLGKRYTKKQKAWFLEEVVLEAKKQGWDSHLVSSKTKFKPNQHLVVGNPKEAKWVVMAAYDTPSRLFIPNAVYSPFRPRRNFMTDSIQLLAQSILGFLMFSVVIYLILNLSTQSQGIQLMGLLFGFLALIFIFKFMQGVANPINQNRNSASIAVMLEMLKEKKLKENTAMIFVDHAVLHAEGYNEIKGMKLIPESANVLILDCLASGETLVLAHATSCIQTATRFQRNYNEEISLQPDPEGSLDHAFGLFKKGMLLISGSIRNQEFVVTSTRNRQDYKVDLDRLENIKRAIVDTVEGKNI